MDLEKDIAKARSKHHFFAWLVIGGLALEVIHVWSQPTSWREKFLPLFADFLVFAGVFGETHYSGKASRFEDQEKDRLLQRIAELNKQANEAKERAANSQLELAKLQIQMLPRRLDEAQYNALQTLKGKVEEIIITSTTNFEAARFADQIAQTLANAGLKVRVWPQRLGQVWSEIYIVIPEPVEDYASEPLYAAFKNAGLSVGCGDRSKVSLGDIPKNIPVIMVGEKAPIRPTTPPYALTVSPSAEYGRGS